jgi:hypothetical protein
MVVLLTKLLCPYRHHSFSPLKSTQVSVLGINVPHMDLHPLLFGTSNPNLDSKSSPNTASHTFNLKMPHLAANKASANTSPPPGTCPILGFPISRKFLDQYFSDFCGQANFGIFHHTSQNQTKLL